MSQEDVEVVRRWLWAFERDTDVFVELTHPDIEWAPFEENHSLFRGVEGAMRVRGGWLETWVEHRVDTEEITDAGDDLIFSLHVTGRGKGSGLEVDVRLHLHFKVRDGKIVYVFEHLDRDDALRAVKLNQRG